MARETTTRGRSGLLRHEPNGPTGLAALRPTWRGVSVVVLTAVLVAVALATGDSTLLLMVVVLGLPWLVAPVIVLRRARQTAGAQLHMIVAPPLVAVGAPSELLIQLVPSSGGAALPPLSLEHPSEHWRMGAPNATASTRPATSRLALAPAAARLIRWDRIRSHASGSSTLPLPSSRRGVFSIGPLSLWVHDPFSLFGLKVVTARPALLVVHPAAVFGLTPLAVRPGESGSAQFSGGSAGAHTDDPGGEWSGLRPYEPGDRLHLLSWQAEARSGALLVHDFRPDSEEVLAVVLDDRAGVHRRHAFEKALGVVYGLAAAAEGGVTDYDVSTLSGRRVRGSTTPEGLVALLTFLAEVQPTRSGHGASPSSAPASTPAPASAPALAGGALLITTPTAVGFLPHTIDQGSLVVVE